MKNIILYVLSTLLILPSLSHGESEKPVKKARWYQINLTLFQQTRDVSLDETFKHEPIKLDFANAIHLHRGTQSTLADSGVNAPLALHHENMEQRAFTEQSIDDDWSQVIAKLDPVAQPILLNMQWVQPVYDKTHASPIYIESSNQILGQSQLKGLFHLSVSRYLHSKLSLQYIPKTAQSTLESISLKQSRRMRSKEVHYLDHPTVAALIRINPVPHPLEQEAELEQELIEQQSEPSSSQANTKPAQMKSGPAQSALNVRL